MASSPTAVRAATFIRDASVIHHGKYDYRLVPATYRSAHEKATIICPVHGAFEQKPANHKKGQGAPTAAAASTQALQHDVTGSSPEHAPSTASDTTTPRWSSLTSAPQ